MAIWLGRNKDDLLVNGIGSGWKLVGGETGWGAGYATYKKGRKHASFFWGSDGTIVMVKDASGSHLISDLNDLD